MTELNDEKTTGRIEAFSDGVLGICLALALFFALRGFFGKR